MNPPPKLAPAEVHVWRLPLGILPGALADAARLLSPEERQRAERLRPEVQRHRFVLGRAWLRIVLGKYCELAPRDVRFCYGLRGKPELMPGQRSSRTGAPLHFSLAHSNDVGLLAVTEAGPVGVDVEEVRTLGDVRALVNQFFSPGEALAFSRVPADRQPAAFFSLWTRKEAVLKATGAGIGDFLSQVEVSFLPGEAPRVLALPAGPWAGCEWSLVDVPVPPCSAGALAVPAPGVSVSRFEAASEG